MGCRAGHKITIQKFMLLYELDAYNVLIFFVLVSNSLSISFQYSKNTIMQSVASRA